MNANIEAAAETMTIYFANGDKAGTLVRTDCGWAVYSLSDIELGVVSYPVQAWELLGV